jgi:hypothetical protein
MDGRYKYGYLLLGEDEKTHRSLSLQLANFIAALTEDGVCTARGAALWAWKTKSETGYFPPGKRTLLVSTFDQSLTTQSVQETAERNTAFGYLVTLPGQRSEISIDAVSYRILGVSVAVLSSPLLLHPGYDGAVITKKRIFSFVELTIAACSGKPARSFEEILKRTILSFQGAGNLEIAWI